MKRKEKRIDVMLSSTSRDLPLHREKATKGILNMGMHPIIMETLGATLGTAISDSLKMVDEAEIYIGIFGMRYGEIPDDSVLNPKRISITEMEYRRAMERKMPVLIFIMSDKHAPPSTVAETTDFFEKSDEGKAKLEALKKELKANHVVAFFESASDLLGHVMQALSKPEVKQKALEIAGDDEDEDASPLPKPPHFYADPPYTLTSEFIGRTKELGLLNAWAKSAEPMMIFEAIGGMGKSAVTWEWVTNYAEKLLKPDGIMWWSFYESGATMSAFVRYALAYITGEHPDSLKDKPMKENFKELLLELAKGKYLIVLDGLERVLVAYHRWNAAQMRDDSVEKAESIIKERDIRTCTDPKDDEILRGLLGCKSSKFLISSRLLPLALEDKSGNLSKGVAHIHLNGLAPDDALLLVRGTGVSVKNERQFQSFLNSFGYHSLLVKLIAGRVLKSHRTRGDFDAWYSQRGREMQIGDFGDDLKLNQSHILQYAFDGLDEKQRLFLSQIAAFGDAVPYDTLAVFNPYLRPAPTPINRPSGTINFDLQFQILMEDNENKKQELQKRYDEELAKSIDKESPEWKAWEAYLAEKEAYERYPKSAEYRKTLDEFDDLLSEMEERGLLRREKNAYDMHPVVRGFAFEQLEGENKTSTFERIRGHFQAQPDDDVNNAKEVADLSKTIAIYRALLGAGKFDEGVRFFMNHLRDKLHDNIAAYYTIIELLIPLFPDGTDTLPAIPGKYEQSHILNTMGGVFNYLGRDEEAIILEGLDLKLNLDMKDTRNLGVSLRNHSGTLASNNQLALSQRTREMALSLAEGSQEHYDVKTCQIRLLSIYKETGQWDLAEKAYKFLQSNQLTEVYWQADIEKYYVEMLVYRSLDAVSALEKAETLAITGKNALIYRQVKRLRGELAMQIGSFEEAVQYFEEGLALARKQGSVETVTYLARLATAHAALDTEKAKGYIEEALEQTFKEQIHDMYNSIAEAYLIMGDKTEAEKYALLAYQSAWADGEPYVWWWGLERAKKTLDALNVSYPKMPPYDESKIGKIPYEDEIRAYIAELEQENKE